MEYIRNRKTVQMIIKNRKTEVNFDQNRKSKTGSKIREDVHVVEIVKAHSFCREFGKTPNCIEEEIENPILFLPKTKNPRAK